MDLVQLGGCVGLVFGMALILMLFSVLAISIGIVRWILPHF